MTKILVDANMPYRVTYLQRRGRKPRHVYLWTMRKISIVAPSAADVTTAFRITSVKPRDEPKIPYDIRAHDNTLWWPVLDHDGNLVKTDQFLSGLASGTADSLHILNLTAFWFDEHQPTYEEYFGGRVGDRILENWCDNSYTAIQRGAARILLCDDLVYFAGGAPVFFGCWHGHSSSTRSMSLHVGSQLYRPGRKLFGASDIIRLDSRFEGHIFDLSELDREIALLESLGVTIDLVHKIESACDLSPGEEALHICADAALRYLLNELDSSSAILAEYRNLIPDRLRRHGSSELVPLDICRTILSDAVRRHWPENLEWRQRTVAGGLARATYVLKRLVLKNEPVLAPEDEEAIASL